MRLRLFIEEEKSALRRVQRNLVGTPDYVRIICILMYDNGRSSKSISEDPGISTATIYRYVGGYQLGGVESLLESRNKGCGGLPGNHQASVLRKELKEHVYTDAGSVSEWILQTSGVSYTPPGSVELPNRIGFTYKKTTEVPCGADCDKQLQFVEKLSEALSGKDENSVVYYADGVHPTHNSRPTYARIEKGEQLEQPTVSGRDRVNINGLLNAYDVTDVIVHGCKSVNARSTRELYGVALEKHPEASCIYIISDNARYYQNKELKERVGGTRIKQIFLPPYSPNLNLIERLWKFLRKKFINTGFYRTREEFRRAVKRFFENITDFKEGLDTLLPLNFRSVNSQTISL